MDNLKKLKAVYRARKSASLKFVYPDDTFTRLFYRGRPGYKETLIKVIILASETLKKMGVNVKIIVGDDLKENKKVA